MMSSVQTMSDPLATFTYAYSVSATALDSWGEQQFWDEATRASFKFRMALVQYWSTATPKQREMAEANIKKLEGG